MSHISLTESGQPTVQEFLFFFPSRKMFLTYMYFFLILGSFKNYTVLSSVKQE